MNPIPLTADGVLGAMITPSVLISASGLLVVSTSNRLARVADRVRTLTEELEEYPIDSDERSAPKWQVNFNQLEYSARRLLLLRSSMFCLYQAIGLLILSSIVIGVASLLQFNAAWIPAVLGLCGVLSMLYASVLLVREANLAVVSTLEEIEFIRTLAKERRA
jgi:hypothetical protein